MALEFTPNPLWSHPDITVSPEDRISTAKEAIERAREMLDEKELQNGTYYGATAMLYSQMAEFDLLTNQTTYQELLYQGFELAKYVREDFLDDAINSGLDYGIAAAQAYKAYQNESFVSFAQAAWNSAMACTISSEGFESGKLCGQNVTDLQVSCNNATMTGGTLGEKDTKTFDLSARSTGAFLLTSALLAEIVTDTTEYLDAATRTADFLLNHLIDTQGAVQDGINEKTCVSSPEIHAYNAGLVMEGLAVLSATQHYPRFQDGLSRVLKSSVTSRAWQNDEGVISSDSGQYIVRGLSTIYGRNLFSPAIRNYIKDYIGVQYNAVLNNSRNEHNPNIYSGSWTGPPPVGYSIENQTSAISVLLSVIPLRNETVEAVPTGLISPSPSAQPSNNEQARSLNTGAVSGGAVGGAIFIALLAGITFFLRSRRRRARSLMALDEDWPERDESKDSHSHLRPYIFPIGPKPRPRKEKQFLPMVAPDASLSLPDTSNATLVPGPSNEARAVPNNENESEPPRLGNVPTSELVRALNDRLQPEQWREDEVPPEYASHHG